MRTIIPILAVIIVTFSCAPAFPRSVPTGTWKYRLVVNGTPMGRCISSTELKDGKYTSVTDMEVNAGTIKNHVKQTVVETVDFKPVSLESVSTMDNNGKVEKTSMKAAFDGNQVKLTTDGTTATYTIGRPFILEGNYHMGELIKLGFKNDSVVKAYVYEPSIDYEQATLMIVKVLGRERMTVAGKERDLIHVGFAIENMKNIDMYIDEKGVMIKAVIIMLNNRMELELE